jgi:hypothetical protein
MAARQPTAAASHVGRTRGLACSASSLRARSGARPDAVTPDAGRVEGRAAIVQYLMSFADAFSELSFETDEMLEIGNIASMRASWSEPTQDRCGRRTVTSSRRASG